MKTLARYLCGVVYIVAGVNHFVSPAFYASIMPPYLPWHLTLVYVSGIAELVLGALLLFTRWQVIAAWGLIGLLIAVFPANVHMALHPDRYRISPVLLWLRLPLQGVLMVWAYVYTRRPVDV